MVAIKDYEFPCCCDCCIAFNESDYGDWCKLTARDVKNKNVKLENCPLVEIEQSEDCVSRQPILEELNRLGRHAFKDDTDYDCLFDFVDRLPLVTPTHGTCKDCEHSHTASGRRVCRLLDFREVKDCYYCADYEKRGDEE